MRKHFLLLLLMTLLPLAGWAATIDVEVRPFDASVDWTGAKPAQVQSSWITCTPAVDADAKNAIAAALTIQDLDSYNAGIHTYKLQKSANSVTSGGDTYNLMVSSSYSAELTINKIETAPTVNGTGITNATGLAYTSSPQALLTAGATATTNGVSVDVMYATSETAETWYSLADFKETNAGSYDVWYKVVGNDNYVGSDPVKFATQTTIDKATQDFTAAGAAPTANEWTYDVAAHALAIAPTVPLNGTYEYCATNSETDADWTTDPATITATSNADNKIVWWRVKSDNYEGKAATQLTATINKATPVINAEGVLNTGWTVYDGQNHNLLLKDATATIGENELANVIRYKWRYGTSGSYSGSKTSYADNAFKNKKNAGVYQINIYLAGTDDYEQVSYTVNGATPSINVAKADMTGFTAPVAKTGLKATNDAQDLVEYASWGDNTALGTFQYKVGEADWSADAKGTIAGTYSVNFQIVPADAVNYNTYTIAEPLSVTIAAKDKVTIAIPANQSFGYGTTPTPEYTATWDNKGTDVLDETALTWTWYTGATGDTQAAKVGGYYPAGEYYVMVSGLAVTGQTSASQEIVYPTDRQKVKITAGQIAATIGGEATYGVAPTFTLTHVSGLSDAEAETLNANSSVLTVTVKKDGAVVNELEGVAPTAAGLAALDAGTYTLEATAEYTPNTNYAILVSAGTLVVSPNTAALTVGEIADVTYKAAKWEPEVTVTGLTAGKDYTVAYGDGTHDNTNAGTGLVTITGIGNYAGATGSQTFTINKANLTITADNFTGDDAWTYGTTEPTYTATVTGYLDGESFSGTLDGIDGTLKVKRTSNETVGMHTGALVAGFYNANDVKIEEPVATNYNLEFVAGNLQVAKGAVVIKLKNKVGANDTYGDDPATSITAAIQDIANYEYVSGLSELEAANFASIIDVRAATYELATAEYQVATDYAFTIAGVTSTNYTVTVPEGGIYNVGKKSPITVQANDQAIDWSNEFTDDDAPNTTVIEGETGTVTIITSESEPGLRYNDAVTAVISAIVIESTKVGEENVISLTAAENGNYEITTLPGTLTVTGVAEVLALSTADTDLADKLTSYAGKTMDVTIDFNPRNGRTLGGTRNWEAGSWVTLVLPFEISVADLSKALGYAIVNEIDDSRTEVSGTESKFYGKLTMKGSYGNATKLAANKPILVKIADDIAAVKEGVIDFGTQTIVAPSALSVDAGGGAKFTGTYASKTVKKDDDAAIWFMLGNYEKWAYITTTSSASWTILPFEGFIDMSSLPEAAARNMTFYFEEIDGSTTAIKSVSVDDLNSKIAAEGMYNMNGMKLNTVPTQKGVYIMNGKKVVIK